MPNVTLPYRRRIGILGSATPAIVYGTHLRKNANLASVCIPYLFQLPVPLQLFVALVTVLATKKHHGGSACRCWYITKIKCAWFCVCITCSISVSLVESPDSYLEGTVFPILLPALEQLLRTAVQTEVSSS